MRGWMLDLNWSFRILGKSPGFTFLAILCLGLGIGVNASMFSLLNFLYLRPMPVQQPDRLVTVSRNGNSLISYPDYRDFRDRNRSLEGLATSSPTESSLDFDGITHSAAAEAVSRNYPAVIGVRPYLGRWFQNEDEQSAVLSYRTWQRWFHGDPKVLGKRVRSETQWYTVIGVAPREFEGIYLPMSMDLWVPLHAWLKQYPTAAARYENRAAGVTFVFGRMKAGVAASQVAAELSAIAGQMRKESAQSAETRPVQMRVELARGVPNEATRRTAAPVATVLMAVVGAVLLIACVNVGNLLVARAAGRQREISVRLALGASRARVLRQLLTESVLLATGGGLAGIVLGVWTNHLWSVLLASGPYETLLRLDLSSDARVLAFTAAVSLATTMVFGLRPSWRASRTDLVSAMKGSAGSARTGLRRFSLVAQVSLSLVLLVTAGLFLRVLGGARAADPGFAVANRLYVTTLASAPEFTPETKSTFYRQTLERLRATPGVKNAAVTNPLPLTPIWPGCAALPGGDQIPAMSSTISPDYLHTMNLALIAGRDFGAADPPDGPRVAIVNETLAKRMWPGRSAIGQRVLLGCRDALALEVVGVARDSRFVSMAEPPAPHIYRPLSQDSGGLETIVVETAPSAGAMAETVRKTIAAANPNVRIYGVKPLEEWVDQSYWQVRWEVSLLGAFAGLALVLAAVGLYGVIACHVTMRTHEIGIRGAVGATPRDIFALVIRQGLGLALSGVAIGLVLSAGLARLIARLLAGVSPMDPLTYAAVSLLWLAVAAAACYLPARRAARIEPIQALRYE